MSRRSGSGRSEWRSHRNLDNLPCASEGSRSAPSPSGLVAHPVPEGLLIDNLPATHIENYIADTNTGTGCRAIRVNFCHGNAHRSGKPELFGKIGGHGLPGYANPRPYHVALVHPVKNGSHHIGRHGKAVPTDPPPPF